MSHDRNASEARKRLAGRLLKQEGYALLGALGLFLASDWALLRASRSDLAAEITTGVLAAQPVLLALWTAWAPYPARSRLPLGLTALLLVVFLYASYSSLLGSAFWLVLCSATAFGLLLLVRWRRGWGFRSHYSRVARPPSRFQFSLRYLLYGTTAAALLLAMGVRLAHKQETFSIGFSDLPLALLISQLFAAVVLLAAVLAVRTSSLKGALRNGIVLVVATLVACLLAVWWICLRYPPNPFFTITFKGLLISFLRVAASGVVVSLATGAALRFVGYRIAKSRC